MRRTYDGMLKVLWLLARGGTIGDKVQSCRLAQQLDQYGT